MDMNASTAAKVFEIAPSPITTCGDFLCMACTAGTCPSARPWSPEAEEGGALRLAVVGAEYDAHRAALDCPVVASLDRAGALALVDALALLLDCPAVAQAAGCDAVRAGTWAAPPAVVQAAPVRLAAAPRKSSTPYQPSVGDRVQRRSGAKNTGEVVEVSSGGARVRVRWTDGKRFHSGADYDVRAWCDASALKPAGQQSAHAEWCATQGKVVANLIARCEQTIRPKTGTGALYAMMGLSSEESLEMFRLSRGKVRSRAVYEGALGRLRAFLAGRVG